jgi:hypothetical protein
MHVTVPPPAMVMLTFFCVVDDVGLALVPSPLAVQEKLLNPNPVGFAPSVTVYVPAGTLRHDSYKGSGGFRAPTFSDTTNTHAPRREQPSVWGVVRADKELLLSLVEADEATRPDRRAFLIWTLNTRRHPVVEHPGFGDDGLEWPEGDIYALAEAGYIRLDETRDPPRFDVTQAGVEQAARLRRASEARGQRADTGNGGHAMDWGTRVLPVLAAVGRAYANPQPEIGVSAAAINAELGREESDPATGLVLDELVMAGYLTDTMSTDVSVGPLFCRLTEKGLQATAGWPSASGEAVFERLLVLLDDAIAAAPTDEERSKLERVRDGVLDVGKSVITGVLTALATGKLD